MNSIPRIVLVGPTNVGKSTLFNRLTRTRKAIVCDRPGVTVDRHEHLLENSPMGPVFVIDTGGVGIEAKKHTLGAEIERAAALATREADLILFVVDGTRELALEELEIASWLRKNTSLSNDRIWIVVNKSDTKKFDPSSYFGLGYPKLLEVSAENNLGLDDLWEEMKNHLGGEELFASEENESELSKIKKAAPRILVLGRPNVGKSTLLNAIIGTDRHVVSDTPGTTRDPIESSYDHKGMMWRFWDTAGLRRPGRLERDVEWVAKEKLKDQAREADLAIMLIDSSEGVTDLDANIAGMALDFGLSLVLVFNKWDKMGGEKAEDMMSKLERTKDLKLDFLKWCPQVRLSALTGKGIPQLIKTVERVLEARRLRVQTAALNSLFETKFKDHSHPLVAGKIAKFYYLSQVKSDPPEFVLFGNVPSNSVHFSYKRYISNTLRSEFGFEGTPIKLHFKNAK